MFIYVFLVCHHCLAAESSGHGSAAADMHWYKQ